MKALASLQPFLVFATFTFLGFTIACGGGSGTSDPAPHTYIQPTANPLVAQFIVDSPCPGQAMVEFGPDTSYGRTTPWYAVAPMFSNARTLQQTKILVAGMRASTTYHMRSQIQCTGGNASATPDLTFTTGPLPSLPFPTLTVTRPSPSTTSRENPGIEMIDVIAPGTPAYFTDRDANPIWYYDVGAGNYAFPFKFLPNGHILVSILAPTDSTLREIDLIGNTIGGINVGALNTKLEAAGYNFKITSFHHDILPLANGHIIALAQHYEPFTNLPGYPGTISVAGDVLIDLDQNWDPVWVWDTFDHLDINRHLNGLPDWTHGNALVYSPADGNILFSMRHQSWVIKIDYNNGAGTGNIIWKLGYQGDFAFTQDGIPSDDPSLWFSFQHFPTLVSQNGSQTTLAIWDNGDNRVLNEDGELCLQAPPGGATPSCYSRATLFQLDESAMVANLLWADPLVYFGVWGGSINQLGNDNVEFDLNAPLVPPNAGVASEVQEVTQTSTPQIVWKMDITPLTATAYRAYRVPSLYPGVSWQY
ncbi:MAG: aryl-sulfate sulfotransferase [Candidatus Sulfotelmatobacter sp.]